jgi:hypothetical protein
MPRRIAVFLFCSTESKDNNSQFNKKKKWLMALLVKRGSGKLGVEHALLASGYACVWNARTNEPENHAWLHQA